MNRPNKKYYWLFLFFCLLFACLLSNTSLSQQPNYQYTYDETGQLQIAVDLNGNVLEYVYDATGNILEIKRSIAGALAIFGFTPTQGSVGTAVKIQGQGFDSVTSQNQVNFNGTPAQVTSASSFLLEAIVPAGASTGPIGISVSANNATSSTDFVVLALPVITSIQPNLSLPGKTIPVLDVTGTNRQGSTFTFVSDLVPPAMSLGAPAINPNGNAASMALTIGPNAVGTFTLIGQNTDGASSPIAGPANTFRVLDPTADEDNDGLTNAEEDTIGTDLFNPDTDGDGLLDIQEVSAGTDPLIKTIPTGLSCGAVLSDSIDNAGESDFFSFSGNAGDILELVLVENGSNWGGLNFINAPQATVISPTGVQIDQFDATKLRQITLPETGTYLIRVNANNLNAIGTYQLALNCLLPASPPPTPIACGDNLSGSIDAPGESDLYSFTGTSGDLIEVGLVETGTSWGGQNFVNAPRVTIISPSGAEVDQFNATQLKRITLAETGTFLLRVNANNLNAIGTYQLTLNCLLPASPPPPPIACGDNLSGSIDAPGESDMYSFTGRTGDLIEIGLVETGSSWGGQNFVNSPRVTVISPSGVQVDQFDATQLKQYTLSESGTYLLRVNANNLGATGTYQLALNCLLPTSPPPTPIACGDNLSGSIDAPGESDIYGFTGTTGDLIEVGLVETGSSWGGQNFVNDPRVTVISPSGVQVDQFDATQLKQYTLSETGTYLIRVTANNLTATGTYNLGLNCLLPTSPPPTAMA